MIKGPVHYIWKYRLVQYCSTTLTSGEQITVINSGKESAGGEFFTDARIRIGDRELTGNILLHESSSILQDNDDKEHADVILHVCLPEDGQIPLWDSNRSPMLIITLPDNVKDELRRMTSQTDNLPCHESLAAISSIDQHAYMSRLLVERIEEKGAIITDTLKLCEGRWNDALLKTTVRSFGFGIQSAAFNDLAEILNIRALEKHRDNLLQIEAIMFGQAGLLDEKSIPYYYLENARSECYYRELAREFTFLRNKFGLRTLDSSIWSSNYTPHVRIARLAQMYHREHLDISRIVQQCGTVTDYHRLIDCTLHGYWSNHSCIGGTATSGNGSMSRRHLDIITINTIVPIIYIWGKLHGKESECSRAEDMLHQISHEENRIVRQWKQWGAKVECAADSQAVLQLDKRYCRMHRCADCLFAYHHIRQMLVAR